MATSTTNLGLTKPAGTDKIRIAQINGNMDILDDKIGAVGNTSLQAQITSQNQAIAKFSLGSYTNVASYDALKTLLGNTASAMSNFEVRNVIFSCTSAFETFGTALWTAIITKNAENYFSALCYPVNKTGIVKVVRRQGSSWYIEDYVIDNGRVLIDRNISSTVSDCNSITQAGLYRLITTTANKPSNINYGVLIHMMSNDYITQICVGTNGNLATRGVTGGSWKSWIPYKNVLTAEYTATTSGNGNAEITFSSNVIVVGAYAKRPDTILTYFPGNASAITESGHTTWYINARSAVSPYNGVANTSITMYVQYIVT